MRIGIYAGAISSPVFIENLVNGLADKGGTVFIYGKAIDRNYQFSNSAIIQRKIPLTKFGILLYSIYVLSKLIIMQPQLFLEIVNILRKNSTNWIQFLKRSCRVIPPFLDKLDILHIQWAKMLVQYPEFIEKIKCPVVLSLRGTHINISPVADEYLSKLYKKYFPVTNGFHAVSQSIAQEVEKYGVDSKQTTVINPAVDEKLLNYKTDKVNNLDSDILHIISVGRCHWVKGYTFVLDVMSILRKEKVDFNYTIIAGGRDQENILYQIDDLGLIECVNFINDELSHDEILKKISECDLLLLPSLEEGISNVVLEAMALGIPVISTDCGGMGEVINNGKNGFLVPVLDVAAMVDTIQKFIDLDKMSKKNIINNARETINHNHLLSHQIDQFKIFYNNIIKIMKNANITTKNNPAALQKVSPLRLLKLIKNSVQRVINGQYNIAKNIFIAEILNYLIKLKRKNQFYCNLCKCESPNFLHTANGDRILFNSICPNCSSRKRHRGLNELYNNILKDFDSPKILHFAPEPVFYKLFHPFEYLTADLELKDVDLKLDIENIEYDNDSFDFIICNHVLEHVSNDYNAIKELYRILKYDGIAIITVPGNWRREEIIEYNFPDDNGHYRDYGLNFASVLENIFSVIEYIDLYKYNEIYHLPIGLTPKHDLAFLCRKK